MVPLGTTEPIWGGEGWTRELKKLRTGRGYPLEGKSASPGRKVQAGRPRPFDLGQLTTLWLAGES